MKRWTFRILLCLFLGVVTTVGVAWASSVFVGFGNTYCDIRAYRSSADGFWNVETCQQFSAFRVGFYRSSQPSPTQSIGPLPEDLIPTWFSFDQDLNESHSAELWDAEARGWPMVALWSTSTHWYKTLDGTDYTLPIEGAIELPLSPFIGGIGDYPRVLPLRPIWLGVFINTLFYGVVWYALFFGISTARRTIRRRRGLCVKCGYDLRGHSGGEVCPECGVGWIGFKYILSHHELARHFNIDKVECCDLINAIDKRNIMAAFAPLIVGNIVIWAGTKLYGRGTDVLEETTWDILPLLRDLGFIGDILSFVLGFGVPGVLAFIAGRALRRFQLRKQFSYHLFTPACFWCGYSLKGHESVSSYIRCPECGKRSRIGC